MDEFLRVNLGNILTIITFLTGGVYFVSTIKASVEAQGGRLNSVESEIHELRKVMVSLARQEERMTAMDQRMLAQGSRLDRITNQLYRHGPQEEKD